MCESTGRSKKKYSYLFWGLIPVTVETKIDQDPSCLLGGSEKQKLCFFKKFVWQICAPLTAKLKWIFGHFLKDFGVEKTAFGLYF